VKSSTSTIEWLLEAEEPWVRLGVLRDLLERPDDDLEVERAHRSSLSNSKVKMLLTECRAWPGYPLKNHKDAKHPLHKLGILADMGFSAKDRGMKSIVGKLLAHRADCGSFQTQLQIPERFGGSGQPDWFWMLCDAPLVLHALMAFGLGDNDRVCMAAGHLVELARSNGWPCASSISKFRGPGRKDDPCPYATLVVLRALSLSSKHNRSPACRKGTEMLLSHWERRTERKIYLFGIGTDFAKLKYPMVWYDILHVVDVLSRFPWSRKDPRFVEMLNLVLSKADEQGLFTPESVWMAYKGFDFAQKKVPSPTLTLAVERLIRRCRA